jgi:3D (Asp-Asp-Asp) domain-containing protein
MTRQYILTVSLICVLGVIFSYSFKSAIILHEIKTIEIKDTVEILIPSKSYDSLIVTATCYNPDAKQCNSQFWITADMSIIDTLYPEKHRWIAVSRDLLDKGLSMGDTIEIEGTWVYDGKWIVKDKMNARWSNKIDFLVKESMYMNKWDSIIIKY